MKLFRITSTIIATLLLTNTTSLKAQNIDLSFGENGYLSYNGNDSNSELNIGRGENSALQTDGKIVVSITKVAPASSDWYLYTYRYFNDGMPDSTFGINGVSKIFSGSNTKNYDLVIQPDNKIVLVAETEYCINGVCGAAQFLMVRLKTNGYLDSTFGNNGKVLSNDIFGSNGTFGKATRIKVQSNGKFIIAGRGVAGKGFVARINSDGSRDNSFATNGVFADTTSWAGIKDIDVNSQGKIIVLQNKFNYLPSMYPDTINLSDIYLIKLTTTGNLDNTFGLNGRKIYSISNDDAPTSVIFRDNEEIIVGGSHQWNNTQSNQIPFYGYGSTNIGFVSFLNSNGSLHPLGNVTVDVQSDSATFIHKIILVENNHILFVGKTINLVNYNLREKALVGQLNPNGMLDVNFSNDGIMQFDLGSIGTSGFGGKICNFNDIDVAPSGETFLTGARNPIAGNTLHSLFLMKLVDMPHVIFSSDEELSTDKKDDFTLYPNPNEGLFTIYSKNVSVYSIISIEGKLIETGTLQKGNNAIQMNQGCPNGIYLVKIEDLNGSQFYLKFIKN